MREELKIIYHCDAENCPATTRVWEEDGEWLGRDLESEVVFLKECGLPLPPTWVIIGDQHFCPNHNVHIRTRYAPGKDVEIERTGGIYEPIHDDK